MTLVSHLPALGLVAVRVEGLGPSSAIPSPSGILRFSEHVPPGSKKGASSPAFSFPLAIPSVGHLLRDLRDSLAGKSPHCMTEAHSHQRSQPFQPDKGGGVQLGEGKGSAHWGGKTLPSCDKSLRRGLWACWRQA